MKTTKIPHIETLTEEQEQKQGEKLVDMLGLKEAKQTQLMGKRAEPYEPRRYYLGDFGTKTALGVYRSIRGFIVGNE